jgi:hypothetical protein
MWYICFFLILLFLFLYKNQEGLSSSPYEMVQEQAGAIQKLHDQLQTITFSETSIQVLQDDNDTLSNNMNDLQANMPSKEKDRQYPSE